MKTFDFFVMCHDWGYVGGNSLLTSFAFPLGIFLGKSLQISAGLEKKKHSNKY